jgi:hypothetical protein
LDADLGLAVFVPRDECPGHVKAVALTPRHIEPTRTDAHERLGVADRVGGVFSEGADHDGAVDPSSRAM